jgi:very-short-patch-repair endonuclease
VAGIPVTDTIRTLIDLCDVLSDEELESAFQAIRHKRLATVEQMTVRVAAATGRRAQRRLRVLLEAARELTRSEFEDRFVTVVEAKRLPRPEVNQRIGGREVDMLWRRERVIVELDGAEFHDNPASFEQDRGKTLALQAEGWIVTRLAWSQLVKTPDLLATQLQALLTQAQSPNR